MIFFGKKHHRYFSATLWLLGRGQGSICRAALWQAAQGMARTMEPEEARNAHRPHTPLEIQFPISPYQAIPQNGVTPALQTCPGGLSRGAGAARGRGTPAPRLAQPPRHPTTLHGEGYQMLWGGLPDAPAMSHSVTDTMLKWQLTFVCMCIIQ